MTNQLEMNQALMARGHQLSDPQLGLLLDDLQLGVGIATYPERYRQALALVARAAGLQRTGTGVSQSLRQVQWYLNPGAPVAPVRHDVRQYFAPLVPDDALYPIEVIVGELLANVAHHTDSGASIHVAWVDGVPMLTVIDAGDGYEPVDMSEISPSNFEEGAPIGLWLVHQLADEVRITRGPSGGTTVTVTLRVA